MRVYEAPLLNFQYCVACATSAISTPLPARVPVCLAAVSKYFDEVHEEVNRVDKWKQPTSRLEQELLARARRIIRSIHRFLVLQLCCCTTPRGQRMLAGRRLCWCTQCSRTGCVCNNGKRATVWCGRKCRKGGAGDADTRPTGAANGTGAGKEGTEAPPAEELFPEDMDEHDLDEVLQLQQWSKEREFWKALRDCSRKAKRNNNVSLFNYFERLYEDTAGSDCLYSGVHEICTLVRSYPCNPGFHRDCEARHLVATYIDVKVRPLALITYAWFGVPSASCCSPPLSRPWCTHPKRRIVVVDSGCHGTLRTIACPLPSECNRVPCEPIASSLSL